jgi:hypothetical protein
MLAYITLLLMLWAASMAELVLGLSHLGTRALAGWAIFGGASMAGTTSVTAAEDVAEWLGRRRGTAPNR